MTSKFNLLLRFVKRPVFLYGNGMFVFMLVAVGYIKFRQHPILMSFACTQWRNKW